MTNAALRRTAASSILALACFGAAAPVATAGPAPTSQATSVTSAATAGSLAYSWNDCRRAASTTTSMRLKVLNALADPGCRRTLGYVSGIIIRDGGAFAARICARSQQPDGFIYKWMVFFISGGMATTCAPY